MNNLTLGSLFDGSGGFPLGGLISGITPVWASEIEPFPIRVTTKRLPFMKHYGDISQMDGGKIEPVDIITFGSPCTDMSVAGRRAGLEGQQSVLFYQAIRIIKEMRCATNGKYPRYIVWENVPGAFSSNSGEDFKAVLEAVIGVAEPDTQVPMPEKNRWPYADCYMGDGWSVAYRVLDAQFWGVPQRRKRIYLVADFAGGRAFDILFKSEGLSGYSAEGFRSWQRTAGSAADCTGTASLCLNDQGGQRMDVTDDVTATLRTEAHHPPCVLESAGFCTEHSSKSRSIGYEEETSPTLRAGVVPATVYENHSQDTRYTGPIDTAPTVSATYGMGGNNQPFVVSEETPKTLKIRSGCEGGGKGALIQENKSATLSCNNDQTLFEPCNWDGQQTAPTLTAHNAGGNQRMPDKNHFNCVLQAYGICSKESNAMKSDNPHSGIYEADTSRTIDGNGGNPGCNQGGIAVVESYAIQGSMIGRDDKNGPQGDGINEDVSFTLNTVDRHAVYTMTTGSFAQVSEDKAPTVLARDYKDPTAVCYGIGRDTFNQGKNAKFAPTFEPELQPTLVAKGPGAIQSGYTVRRLTPTECARLQGFPDWWCDDLGIAEPTMADIQYWYDVFETHRRIMGSSTKPKSLKQIAKWLRDPHSDAAEYKMWGNGVALPCVVFVLSGIVWCTQDEAENSRT
ncbi:DNA cytosine methyltransferase [Neglectibacter timonensis]|uniref:DNA (cytosine-5-)-methyltransferase n=1 Tax=Neglectibacter timonensis TaxID=1776382 RepID=A0ABT1S093_9FIRM|nr:DNA cytosine methyltransferase [Neglectibacter timonensis]MCQ4840357.1 DNA cytosine methyltransferase [Neglectibacter timonensis]MCQ4843939.1 DNA cytosine methyltransferase [Neglectibacter timonensis]